MKSELMYIELKSDGLRGEGRIGRVTASKTGKTLYYKNRTLMPARGMPLKANYFDQDSQEDFWVSRPKKDGNDSIFPSQINIDEDVREEYWLVIRKKPESVGETQFRSIGK